MIVIIVSFQLATHDETPLITLLIESKLVECMHGYIINR